MSTKFNKRMALLTVNTGLLLGAFLANNALASECGQIKLITAGSAGVKVAKSGCQDSTQLSAGSSLELSAGSRMWLKFHPSSKGEAAQVICQNKTADTVKVQISGANDPWIKPELKGCDPWKNNKLSCDGGFFCAFAKAKADTTVASKSKDKLSEMTTSVKMRSIIPVPVAVSVTVEDIVKPIKPDIDLCKNLYGVSDKVDMSWKLSGGKIQDLSVGSDNKDFISCVQDVVTQANADQDINIQYSF